MKLRRGWISRHVDFKGVQARLQVNGRETSRTFSAAKYGSLAAAERAAAAWLARIASGLPSPYATGLRERNVPARSSGLPVGVSESVYTLRSGAQSARFLVSWRRDERSPTRVKSFTIGMVGVATAADRRAALARAIAFRKRYEACRRRDQMFDPRLR